MSEAIRAVAQRWRNMSSAEKDCYRNEDGANKSPEEQNCNNTQDDDVDDWSPSDKVLTWLTTAYEENANEVCKVLKMV